jgi:hypothetical protein
MNQNKLNFKKPIICVFHPLRDSLESIIPSPKNWKIETSKKNIETSKKNIETIHDENVKKKDKRQFMMSKQFPTKCTDQINQQVERE